jgi:hypothetical protein
MPEARGGGEAPGLVPYAKELSELRAIVRQGLGLMPGLPPENVTDEEVEQIHEYLKALTASSGAAAGGRGRASKTGTSRR